MNPQKFELEKEIMSQLLLIIGGFILSETIIKYFLIISADKISYWVLPLIAMLLIFEAISLMKNGWTFSTLYITYFVLIIISIVLVKSKLINNNLFSWLFLFILIFSIITFLIQMSIYSKGKKIIF